MKKIRFQFKPVLLTVIVAVCAIIFLIPLIWMLLSSFKPVTEVFATPFHWLPSEWRFQNYMEVWTDEYANRCV